MRRSALDRYRDPEDAARLELRDTSPANGELVHSGELVGERRSYRIMDGIPDFAPAETLYGNAAFARRYYASIAESYDDNVHVTFDLYGEDEHEVRTFLIDLLRVEPGDAVLEVSAGTGRDSERIAPLVGATGELWLLDISPHMLVHARNRLSGVPPPVEIAVGNASCLPYRSDAFDRLFCFTGVGHFPDLSSALREMARVVRPGGRVVFCEKSLPPWLRDTSYGAILINNNPMFAESLPLEHIPVTARNLGVRWFNGDAYYAIDYTVGEGPPEGNFDLVLPGSRGGTFNTRYYGKLEGVTPEAKRLYEEAAATTGESLHEWLDRVVREAAERDLRGAGED